MMLKSINLTIPGLTNDQWEWVNAERNRYLGDEIDFVHVGPNEFGSSTGGSTITLDDDDNDVAAFDDNDANGGGDDGILFRFRANNVQLEISDDENDDFRPPADLNNDDDDDDNLLI
ncbi:hypothetical protein ACF0H5_000284 [Mactra antiquata]